MREFIMMQAEQRNEPGLAGALKRRFANARIRKDLRGLLALMDFQLTDVGFTREQVLWLLRQPMGCDLKWEIERLALNPSFGRTTES